MAKTTEKRTPMVTSENKVARKVNPGFVNPNRGIEVEEGLTMQDVPRHMVMQHLKNNEAFWKKRFADKYSGTHGGSQSF